MLYNQASMNEKTMDEKQVRGEVRELERQVIALGNLAESLFADCAVAMVENHTDVAPELRQEDCRAHERALEIERLCTELLSNGDVEPEQVRFIWASAKIVGCLKRAADESLRIGVDLRACESEALATARSMASVPQMTEMTQSMLSDAIAALANRSAEDAGGLHLACRELSELKGQTADQLVESMQAGELSICTGTALVGVAGRLERIGQEAVGVANQVTHLYRA